MNQKLIAKRKSCSLTQEKVAKAAGVSYRHYQQIEAGKCRPNVETAISISGILGTNVEELFTTQT